MGKPWGPRAYPIGRFDLKPAGAPARATRPEPTLGQRANPGWNAPFSRRWQSMTASRASELSRQTHSRRMTNANPTTSVPPSAAMIATPKVTGCLEAQPEGNPINDVLPFERRYAHQVIDRAVWAVPIPRRQCRLQAVVGLTAK